MCWSKKNKPLSDLPPLVLTCSSALSTMFLPSPSSRSLMPNVSLTNHTAEQEGPYTTLLQVSFHFSFFIFFLSLLLLFITAASSKTLSGLLEFDSKTEAVEALTILNHHQIRIPSEYWAVRELCLLLTGTTQVVINQNESNNSEITFSTSPYLGKQQFIRLHSIKPTCSYEMHKQNSQKKDYFMWHIPRISNI